MEGGPLGGGADAGVVRSRHRKWGAKMASEPQGHGEPEDGLRQRDHALVILGLKGCVEPRLCQGNKGALDGPRKVAFPEPGSQAGAWLSRAEK